MLRIPAVAGRFYPGDRRSLEDTLRDVTYRSEAPTGALGIVVPHAGYVYSGHVAGAVYSQLELPDRYIILCPNHTGVGAPLAILSSGKWQTPIGNAVVDKELAELLKSIDPELREDATAHHSEHALEVQLPFLQFLAESEIFFVPITVGTSDLGALKGLGEALAIAIQKVPGRTLIIASSDMNHYESDSVTRVKDQNAIACMLDLDAEGLYEVVKTENISMCGFGPVTAMLIATIQLGATAGELVKYATSGDIFGERDQVVGYAGLIVK